MSGARNQGDDRYAFSTRYIVNHPVERAEWRVTMSAYVLPRLSLGIEYNPLASDVNPLANWLAVEETRTRPALILGTSSDRIGTENGQSFYATVSKNVEEWIGLPIAPYVGVAYGTFADDVRPIAGGNIRFTDQLSALVIYDGRNTHPTLSWTTGRHVFTAMAVQLDDDEFRLGLAYSASFAIDAGLFGFGDDPHD